MFTVNSRLVITSEDVPFTRKGEELLIRSQSNTHLLVSDEDDNRFKLEKSLLGTHFMVSFMYTPDANEEQMDTDGQTYMLNLEDYK